MINNRKINFNINFFLNHKILIITSKFEIAQNLKNEYLDDPGPGFLVKPLHVPSLTLLQGSINENLEEWKTNILFIILYSTILFSPFFTITTTFIYPSFLLYFMKLTVPSLSILLIRSGAPCNPSILWSSLWSSLYPLCLMELPVPPLSYGAPCTNSTLWSSLYPLYLMELSG